MGLEPAYPRRPRPLPGRDQWALSAPVPPVGDHLRALTAAAPGMALGPDATRSPARRLERAAARLAHPAEGSGMASADHGPEIAPQAFDLPPLPEWPPLDPEPTPPPRLDDPAPTTVPAGDPGADLDAAIRQALADPGPHDEEPAVPRWRWWRRHWRSRWARDRKRED